MFAIQQCQAECVDVILSVCHDIPQLSNLHDWIRHASTSGNTVILTHVLHYYDRVMSSLASCASDLGPLPVRAALSRKDYECAKLLVRFSTDIAQQMSETGCCEEEWEFILNHARESSHKSLSCLPATLASHRNWECIRYKLQDRFLQLFDLNATSEKGTLLTLVIKSEKCGYVVGATKA